MSVFYEDREAAAPVDFSAGVDTVIVTFPAAGSRQARLAKKY